MPSHSRLGLCALRSLQLVSLFHPVRRHLQRQRPLFSPVTMQPPSPYQLPGAPPPRASPPSIRKLALPPRSGRVQLSLTPRAVHFVDRPLCSLDLHPFPSPQ